VVEKKQTKRQKTLTCGFLWREARRGKEGKESNPSRTGNDKGPVMIPEKGKGPHRLTQGDGLVTKGGQKTREYLTANAKGRRQLEKND